MSLDLATISQMWLQKHEQQDKKRWNGLRNSETALRIKGIIQTGQREPQAGRTYVHVA